jgi:PAS domain S-box-containing protein
MKTQLRVLHLEDNPRDAELIRSMFEGEGLACDFIVVDCREAFAASLASAPFDLILSDFSLPDYDGISALKLAREKQPDVPFILVSGTLGEEQAIDSLRSGATDYVLKQRPARLLPAVRRALQDAQERTELRRAEEAMRQSEFKYRHLFESLSDAAFLVEEQSGRILDINKQAELLLGQSRSQIVGRDHSQLYPADKSGEYCRRFLTGDSPKHGLGYEAEILPPTGSAVPVNIRVSRIILHGRSLHLGLFRDATELKKSEEQRQNMEIQLRHAQKMESIGQLAAGIAHEINTPTQYIGDNARFLKDAFLDLIEVFQLVEQMVAAGAPPDAAGELFQQLQQAAAQADLGYLAMEIPKAIQQSLEGVERVARIVRAMKEFSHPGAEGKAPADLNKAIESTLTVSHNEWKYVADLVTDFDPALPAVPCLLGEFNQVILNLVVNAAHAIADVVEDASKGKGTLTVRTRRVGDWAEIRIGDSGTGIPEKIRAKIFDPFFTTKEVGKGTGQGLAIAHAVVVDKHGGDITFETEIGRGTVFVIRLPLGGQEGQIRDKAA